MAENRDEKASPALAQIDSNWVAVHQATLLFIIKDGQVLLIRKKRGLGAGKINGPGGKLEIDETALGCAVREVSEELKIEAIEPEPRGELRFQFVDGYSIHVHIFVSEDFNGQPAETDEAIPLWYPLESVPYAEMWADDVVWLPSVLCGTSVNGRFVFDGDALLEYEVIFSDRPYQGWLA